MHGAHQVAQNSSTTTFPRRLSQAVRAPFGACSNWIVVRRGAGVPFAGSASAGRNQNTVRGKIRRNAGTNDRPPGWGTASSCTSIRACGFSGQEAAHGRWVNVLYALSGVFTDLVRLLTGKKVPLNARKFQPLPGGSVCQRVPAERRSRTRRR